jgi:hypothetical protein
MSRFELGLVLLTALVCGLLCAIIASRKGRSGAGYFVLGCLTGPIGLVITIAIAPQHSLATFAALNPYRSARAHPGWYQDPQNAHVLRWHDGVNWTQQAYDTRPAPAPTGRRSRHRG